ncbi:hypothetical protein DZG00_08610 [Clavibacter lycopersici]|uniref:DUF4352 domain-containing protein n=1 Tax=Clavibacter lycopersici TaxID=2301718 RepID=A0A399T8J8_9MICO|nr:hypothetical protein [Clavibacter lycopersici]RIJ51509.1 hypothetical protein DZG00_08610 [Clavibacter lycopersici]RIJ59659.1 hypothetical protein DZG02_11440 [Clavibacter lycopersici]
MIPVVAALVAVAVIISIVLVVSTGPDGDTSGTANEEPAFPSDPNATSSPVTSQDPADGQAPPEEASPVALDATAEPVPGVSASIGSLAAVDGVADGPGEVAGPAVSFTLTIENRTDAAVSLASTVVTVASGDDLLPADPLSTGSAPLPAEAAPGETVTGTYVFALPLERRDDVRIAVDYMAGTPVVVFQGPAPRR